MTEQITVPRELLRQALDFVDHMQHPQRLKDALRTLLDAPAVGPVSDDLRDRLVAISAAIADQDDRAAQAMIREILSSPPSTAEPDHWSDCATNSEPAYPAGACDCMPTPAMCRAAVEYVNGADVYEKVPREALDIEEGIYREVWIAMQAVAPPPPAEPAVEPFGYFRAEPFGWTDCAPTDEGAKALYEVPPPAEPAVEPPSPSPTAGMNIAQRILHVGGRNNAAGYVEFGSIQAVEALVRQVLRDLPPEVPMLSEQEIDECDEAACISFRRSQSRAGGQMVMPSDGFDWHFARAIEAAVRRKAGL